MRGDYRGRQKKARIFWRGRSSADTGDGWEIPGLAQGQAGRYYQASDGSAGG